jgi:hypothetical protein
MLTAVLVIYLDFLFRILEILEKAKEMKVLRIGRKEQADRPSEGHLRVRLSPKPGRTVGLGRACDPGNSN